MDTLIYMEIVGGGWTCAELSDSVVAIVDACHYINKHPTSGCLLVCISMASKTIEVNRRVGKAWFTRFFIDWSHLISERKPQTIAAICAQFCTRQRYLLHFTQLVETLRNFWLMDITGIVTNPANLINSDKCTNMINGIRSGNCGKLVGGLGGAATTIVGEDHSYNVLMVDICGLDGHKYNPQLNYTQKTLDPGLFSTKSITLDDFWVYVTEKDTQTKESFYEFSKWIIQAIRDRGVEGTIVWITDGRISCISLRSV